MSAYRIRPGRPVAPELARVMQAQLKAARTRLQGWEADPEGAFHEARRRLKKVRAAARVARSVDEPLARRINDLAREAAKTLSGARDADVVASAAAKLAKTSPDAAAAGALARFAGQAARSCPADDDRAAIAAEARALVAEALEVTRRLCSLRAPRDALKRAASRTVKRADRAFRAVHPNGARTPEASEETRHEWRKRVKELRYVERLLTDVWPLDRTVSDALTNNLGKKLGEERDFLLLAERLRRGARACGGASARDAALAYVESRRARLAARSDKLGRRLHEA